ncbi:MAG TPA: heme ABC transporter substrate-binding protein IsdE [Pseudogracilibacillus sp.]|nr:heme ABC transporter substrate-binding protein IsdE [Pseudogracilibacillus sp.]
MKGRYILTIFTVILLSSFLVACQGSSGEEEPSNKEESNNVSHEQEEESNERIVATTVALTEIMDQLNIDLVGVPTSYKDLPDRYEDLTDTGNPMSPDMEVILSLKPTEVYSVTTLLGDLEGAFDQYDVPVNFVDLTSVEAMFAEIEQIGETYEREEEAEQLVQTFDEKLAQIEEKTAGLEEPSVLILMGIPGSYIVGTENSYIGDLVERAGGKNVIEGRDEEYIAANTEHLQQLDPDIILRAAHGAPEEVVKMFDQEFKENDIWTHFSAVQNDRVYDLEESLFGTTANLAAEDALEELVQLLHDK